MRDYQLFGTEWLITLYENGFNGILADEMGLGAYFQPDDVCLMFLHLPSSPAGKTLQTIGFLAHIRAQDVKGFVLIVAPLSVLDNWISEFERFAPLLKVERYHGTPSDRLQMRENWKRLPERERPIIVTSFEIAIRDRSALAGFTWKYLAVDEGHRLKNMDSKLLRDLKSLNSENRVLLTGTPLQNNLAELWSLLNFCLPEVFSSLQEFQSWFDFESDLSNAGGENSILNKEEKDKVVTHLHTILRPFLLRRVKSDVEASLPKKKEYLLYAPLTPFQHKLYSAALTGSQALRTALAKQSGVKDDGLSETASTADVDEMASTVISSDDEAPRRTKRAAALTLSATGSYSVDSGSETAIGKAVLTAAKKKEAQKRAALAAHAERASKPGRGSLNNLLMQLRKICNHPYLFEGTEEEDEVATLDDSDDEVLKGNVRKQLQSSKVGKGKGKQKLPDIVIKSGKMLLLERLLPVLFERGHKVLIFSQMVNILYILEEWCVEYKGWKCSRLDGGVSLDDRKTAINNFNNDPDTKIFLLSTRAGGLGINLVAADTVILFDSDWVGVMESFP